MGKQPISLYSRVRVSHMVLSWNWVIVVRHDCRRHIPNDVNAKLSGKRRNEVLRGGGNPGK